MKLYLIRHGIAKHNIIDKNMKELIMKNLDYLDCELLPEGKKSAFEEGVKISNVKFDTIYCSPLSRCIQTMDQLLNANNNKFTKSIILDDRLIETQGYQYSNKRKEKNELIIYLNEFNKSFDTNKVLEEYNFTEENSNIIKNRINSFLNELKQNHKKDENILIVTHYSWLINFFEIVTGESLKFNNCEMKIINF